MNNLSQMLDWRMMKLLLYVFVDLIFLPRFAQKILKFEQATLQTQINLSFCILIAIPKYMNNDCALKTTSLKLTKYPTL